MGKVLFKGKKNNSGSTIVIVLLMTSFVLILSTLITTTTMINLRMKMASSQSTKSFIQQNKLLMKSGLRLALFLLNVLILHMKKNLLSYIVLILQEQLLITKKLISRCDRSILRIYLIKCSYLKGYLVQMLK